MNEYNDDVFRLHAKCSPDKQCTTPDICVMYIVVGIKAHIVLTVHHSTCHVIPWIYMNNKSCVTKCNTFRYLISLQPVPHMQLHRQSINIFIAVALRNWIYKPITPLHPDSGNFSAIARICESKLRRCVYIKMSPLCLYCHCGGRLDGNRVLVNLTSHPVNYITISHRSYLYIVPLPLSTRNQVNASFTLKYSYICLWNEDNCSLLMCTAGRHFLEQIWGYNKTAFTRLQVIGI